MVALTGGGASQRNRSRARGFGGSLLDQIQLKGIQAKRHTGLDPRQLKAVGRMRVTLSCIRTVADLLGPLDPILYAPGTPDQFFGAAREGGRPHSYPRVRGLWYKHV